MSYRTIFESLDEGVNGEESGETVMKVQKTKRVLLYNFCRRWRLIVLINVVILGTILVGSWLWPPSYQAASNVIILSSTYPDLLTTPSSRCWRGWSKN